VYIDFSRSYSKVSSVQVIKATFPLMMYRFYLVHVLLMVRVISKRISAHGHHRITRTTSIGIVYRQNRSACSTLVQTIRTETRLLAMLLDISFGLHPIFVTIVSINHLISTQKYYLLINIRVVHALSSIIFSRVHHH
jgi:hypothetical protein